jgi:hypothetical protein
MIILIINFQFNIGIPNIAFIGDAYVFNILVISIEAFSVRIIGPYPLKNNFRSISWNSVSELKGLYSLDSLIDFIHSFGRLFFRVGLVQTANSNPFYRFIRTDFRWEFYLHPIFQKFIARPGPPVSKAWNESYIF